MTGELQIIGLMQAASVLFTGGLLVGILRKAGYSWAFALLGLCPVLATALQTVALGLGYTTMIETYLLCTPIWLVPFLLLAFGTWPRLAARFAPSETFQ